MIGRFTFSGNEIGRLRRAYDKIISKKYRDFFNNAVWNARQQGKINYSGAVTPSTLEGLLSITTLNKYNQDLTAKRVGYSETGWANVEGKFQDGSASNAKASAVTLSDGRVFLNDAAFYQGGALAASSVGLTPI